MPDTNKPVEAPTDEKIPVRPVGRQGRFDPIVPENQDQLGKKRTGG